MHNAASISPTRIPAISHSKSKTVAGRLMTWTETISLGNLTLTTLLLNTCIILVVMQMMIYIPLISTWTAIKHWPSITAAEIVSIRKPFAVFLYPEGSDDWERLTATIDVTDETYTTLSIDLSEYVGVYRLDFIASPMPIWPHCTSKCQHHQQQCLWSYFDVSLRKRLLRCGTDDLLDYGRWKRRRQHFLSGR